MSTEEGKGREGGELRESRSAPCRRVAAFVSAHGFGHAARASAVLAALHRGWGYGVDLFTTVPRWFFDESIPGTYRYHEERVDVGFRQRSALRIDLEATVEELQDFLPFDPARVERLASEVSDAGCEAVLCDIAPLGVAVAEQAGVPSMVLENFTWGWLYEPYHLRAPELEGFGTYLDGWVEQASVHLQARPACEPRSGLEEVPPVSREPRRTREAVRKELGIVGDEPLTVITMGGYGEELSFLAHLQARAGERFLVTGAQATERRDNLILFDNRTALFMPDLLRAADGVVAKLGYGMVAETWREGIPFAHVTRPGFREMAALEAFAAEELVGFGMTADAFHEGAWIERLEELREMRRRRRGPGGSERVAEVLAGLAAGASHGRGGGSLASDPPPDRPVDAT